MSVTKNSISNFKEAKDALKTLAGLAQSIEAFVVSMEQRIDAISELKGGLKQPDLPLQIVRPGSLNVPENVPESWRDRVLAIFKMSDRPMTQKEVVNVYEALEWPKDFASSLYATISSSIAYLARTEKLAKTEKGYKIPQANVPPRRVGPFLQPTAQIPTLK
jgi:hypothetical protein